MISNITGIVPFILKNLLDRKGEITQFLVSLIFFGIGFHRDLGKINVLRLRKTSWQMILLIIFVNFHPSNIYGRNCKAYSPMENVVLGYLFNFT